MKTLAALLLLSSLAQAQQTLRLATVAPEGTAWAHQLKALGHEVEAATDGRVKMKWVFGGIAGVERETLDRIRRGQLDGMAASHFCEKLAPTLRVMRTFGVLRTRAEERYVVQRLRDQIDGELEKEGFVELGVLSLGMAVLFSKEPVRTMEEFMARRWWVSADDDYAVAVARAVGMKVVPIAQHEAKAAFERNEFDGFVAIPASLLAFQWTAVRAYTEMPLGSVDGCLLITQRAWERLRADDQISVRGATMNAMMRLDDISEETSRKVLAEVGPKLGIQRIEPDPRFRSAFIQAVKEARNTQVTPELMQKVLSLLADYRAEHR
jgi:TRAP-type C4-dicarboxylate transport system substrate-binding protein